MHQLLAAIWLKLPESIQRFLIFNLSAKYTVGTNVLIFNNEGQVWLQKHRFWPKYPWGLPGGHLNPNEDPAVAAIRELKEEVSADISIKELLTAEVSASNKRTIIIYYLGQFTSPIGQIDAQEILDARYFHLDALPDDILPSHKRIIRTYKHFATEALHERKDKEN